MCVRTKCPTHKKSRRFVVCGFVVGGLLARKGTGRLWLSSAFSQSEYASEKNDNYSSRHEQSNLALPRVL